MCLNTGTPKNINFSFQTNGKLMALGVPILKLFRVTGVIKCCSICFDIQIQMNGFHLSDHFMGP